MARDLEQAAANLIAEMIYDHGTLGELSGLRDDISDRAWEAADSAVIYYHWAQEIINDYENHPSADCDSADDCGGEYKPSQYRQAMTVYAHGIAFSVIQSEASSVIDAIEEAADELCDECAKLGVSPDDSEIRVTADCIHGWAAHDDETESGCYRWISRQLDGCNAVAIKSGPVWLTYTWEPDRT